MHEGRSAVGVDRPLVGLVDVALHDAVALPDGERGVGAEDGRGGGALHAEGLLRLRAGLEAVEVVARIRVRVRG